MENLFLEIIAPILVMIIVFINIIRKSKQQQPKQPEEAPIENFPPIPLEECKQDTKKKQKEEVVSATIQEKTQINKVEKIVSKTKHEVSSLKREKINLETEFEPEETISVELSSADDLKKAIIYSEILNRKS